MKKLFFTLLSLILLNSSFSSPEHIRITAKRHRVPKRLRTTMFTARQNLIDANVTMINYLNDQYMATIYIGSNLQPFNLLLDTGSAWMWVGKPTSEFTHTYDCAASTTCRENKTDIQQLHYGQGSGAGYSVQDTLTIGDGFIVTDQTFLVVNGIQDIGIFFGDGILGLGSSALSKGYPTFLDNLYEKGLISEKCFSLYVGNDPTSYGGEAGTFIVGGYDPQLMLNEFTYLDVTDAKYWAVDLVSVALGNQLLETGLENRNPKAVIDSGTSLLLFPNKLLEQFYRELSKTASCSLDSMILCDCNGQFPELIITLNGLETIIPPSMYVSKTPSYCQILIQAADFSNYLILGDVFMRQYYTFFSAGNNTIGFALAKNFEPSHNVRTFVIVLAIFMCVLLVLTILRRHYISYKERRYGKEEFSAELASMYVDIGTNGEANQNK